MEIVNVNDVQLACEIQGNGEIPLVMVHGSWVSRRNWDLVVPHLKNSFRVVTYDRRGHSESERPTRQGSIREDVDDLAALIEHLGLAPAWVAGQSFGGSITFRLAGERPDLIRGIIVHEPPFLSLLDDDPSIASMLEEAGQKVGTVVEQIRTGDHRGAAEQFVETVALGPGMWAQLPTEFQKTMIENAPTYLDEVNDPEQLAFDPDWTKGFTRPCLLTVGDHSPPLFPPVVSKLAEAVPSAEVSTFTESGHIPQIEQPEAYAEAITAFIRRHTT